MPQGIKQGGGDALPGDVSDLFRVQVLVFGREDRLQEADLDGIAMIVVALVENPVRQIEGEGDDGNLELRRHLEGSRMEGEQFEIRPLGSCPLGEDDIGQTLVTLTAGTSYEAMTESLNMRLDAEDRFKDYVKSTTGRNPTMEEMAKFRQSTAEAMNGVFWANMGIVGLSNWLLLGKFAGLGKTYWGEKLVGRFDDFGKFVNTKAFGEIRWNEENSLVQPFYALLNASVELVFKGFSVELWGKNLTSTEYATFYFESVGNAFLQEGLPARYGISVKLEL